MCLPARERIQAVLLVNQVATRLRGLYILTKVSASKPNARLSLGTRERLRPVNSLALLGSMSLACFVYQDRRTAYFFSVDKSLWVFGFVLGLHKLACVPQCDLPVSH